MSNVTNRSSKLGTGEGDLDQGGLGGVIEAKASLGWTYRKMEGEELETEVMEDLLMEFCHNVEQSNGVEAGRESRRSRKDLVMFTVLSIPHSLLT